MRYLQLEQHAVRPAVLQLNGPFPDMQCALMLLHSQDPQLCQVGNDGVQAAL